MSVPDRPGIVPSWSTHQEAQTARTGAAPATGVTRREALTDRRFWIHFLQMSVAMVVGMVVGMAALAPLPVATWSVAAQALVMASTMAAGMAVGMLLHRHRPAAIAEMTAAMYAPFLALLPVHALGGLSGNSVLLLGHLLMLPAMILAMLRRPAEYVGHGGRVHRRDPR